MSNPGHVVLEHAHYTGLTRKKGATTDHQISGTDLSALKDRDKQVEITDRRKVPSRELPLGAPESSRQVSSVFQPQSLGALAPGADGAEGKGVYAKGNLHARALAGDGQQRGKLGGCSGAKVQSFRESWHARLRVVVDL